MAESSKEQQMEIAEAVAIRPSGIAARPSSSNAAQGKPFQLDRAMVWRLWAEVCFSLSLSVSVSLSLYIYI